LISMLCESVTLIMLISAPNDVPLLGDFQIVADTNSSWTSAPGPEMSKLVTVVPDLAEPAHIQRCRCPAAKGAERAACSVCGQPLVEMDQLTVLAPVTCGTDRGANEPRF
jgi:hypothetical protein